MSVSDDDVVLASLPRLLDGAILPQPPLPSMPMS
jgi:hypothetical protein